MKFIFVSFFALLAMVNGSQAIDMARCAQLAIANGIPELGIPSHDPMVLIFNLTFHMNSLLGSNFTYKLSKITWTNIPWWKVTKNIVTKNTPEVLDVDGAFLWNNFTFSYNYDFQWDTLKLNGHVEYLYENVTWAAVWEETKPDDKGVKKIKYLRLKQTYDSRSLRTTGFGDQRVVAENLLLALSDIVNEHFINGINSIGNALAETINKVWYGNPTLYNYLVQWCEDHNVTSTEYQLLTRSID